MVLPVYGDNFVMWWRERFVPEMQRNFDYIEGMLEKKDELSLADMAVLLEDAIDMHDRHWKIHWMLNFAQLSATLNLRAVMEKTHGTDRRGPAGPTPELRQRPQLGQDPDALGDEGRDQGRRRAAADLQCRDSGRDRAGP